MSKHGRTGRQFSIEQAIWPEIRAQERQQSQPGMPWRFSSTRFEVDGMLVKNALASFASCLLMQWNVWIQLSNSGPMLSEGQQLHFSCDEFLVCLQVGRIPVASHQADAMDSSSLHWSKQSTIKLWLAGASRTLFHSWREVAPVSMATRQHVIFSMHGLNPLQFWHCLRQAP